MTDQPGQAASAPSPARPLARLAGMAAVAASALLVLVLARSFAWPSTWADETREIGPGGVLSQCFTFNTPRLMIVDIDTDGGGAVAVGIVPRDAAGALTADTMAAHTVAGAYDAALLAGRVDARVGADRDYCVVIYGSPSSTAVRATVQTYLRLW
jgi:hypothetical protein